MNAFVIQECVSCWICHLIKLEYVAKMYYKSIKHVKRISEMIKAEENKVLKKKKKTCPGGTFSKKKKKHQPPAHLWA